MFALVALVVLLIVGRCMGEIEWSGIALVSLIVGVAATLVAYLDLHPVLLTAVCALIDVVLVLKIFKGDIRIN
jgi:hypothetical protein